MENNYTVRGYDAITKTEITKRDYDGKYTLWGFAPDTDDYRFDGTKVLPLSDGYVARKWIALEVCVDEAEAKQKQQQLLEKKLAAGVS